MVYRAPRRRSPLLLMVLTTLALLSGVVQAQVEPNLKPASLARLESLLTKLEGAAVPDLPSPNSARDDFRSLIQEDPAVLAVLADKIPLCVKPWTAAVLADIVAEADYRPAVPSLLQRLKRFPNVFYNLRITGYDPRIAVPAAIRALAGSAEVPLLAAALHDKNVALRRDLLVLLADIDTPEAYEAIRDFLATGKQAPRNVTIVMDPPVDPEEQEIAAAVALDLQAFGDLPNERSVGLIRAEDEPPARNERRYSLTAAGRGYEVVVRRYRGMWIVTKRDAAWIA
jgi:hypothetical protein